MKILDIDPWMRRRPDGKYQLRKVTRAMNRHFPLNLRTLLAEDGAYALTAHLMNTEQLSLADAWSKVKYLVNSYPTNKSTDASIPL